MKLTVQELGTIIEVMNIRSNRQSTIKDLRLLDSTVQMLQEHMPKQPEQPKEQTDEIMKAFVKEMEEYHAYEVEIELHQGVLNVIRSKFSSTNVFFDDKPTRERVIKLADKLGL